MSYVIIKYIKNNDGIELPVILVDSHSEILEFDNTVDAENYRLLFQNNSDSGYKYEIKKL